MKLRILCLLTAFLFLLCSGCVTQDDVDAAYDAGFSAGQQSLDSKISELQASIADLEAEILQQQDLLEGKQDTIDRLHAGNAAAREDGYAEGYEVGYADGKAHRGSSAPKPSAPAPVVTEPSVSEPVSQTVYITNTGTKYHESWCGSLWNSKKAVELDWAIANGYDACKKCH